MNTAQNSVTVRRPRRRSAGFSLVEVALAMLVISVGVLAAVSLFPTSMDSNKKAIDDTQIGLYADYVMSTLQGYVANTNSTSRTWNTFVNSPAQIAVAAAADSMWEQPTNLLLRANNQVTQLRFTAVGTDIEEMNLVARLQIVGSRDNPSPNVRRAVLEIWPFSVANTNGYRVYETDLYRGDLP